MSAFQCASAMFPGVSHIKAIQRIQNGVHTPYCGLFSPTDIQLCPQHPGVLNEKTVGDILMAFPSYRYRPHANIRVLREFKIIDASTSFSDNLDYWNAYKKVHALLGSPSFSIHAGSRKNASVEEMFENILRLQDFFKVPVAVEGLYPVSRDAFLLSSAKEYTKLLDFPVHYAIDLSHWDIVRKRDRNAIPELLLKLLESPRCIEIHVSGNNQISDSHSNCTTVPFWGEFLKKALKVNANVLVFSEENQLRRQKMY